MDVVIVEDHHGRHRGEQPADVRLGPRLAVQPCVLLEVRDLLDRFRVLPAPRLDELPCFRRDLVGVDLVAEQEDGVGPLHLASLQLLCVRPQCVDPECLHILGPRMPEVGRLSVADAAGAEDQARAPLVVSGVDDGLRASVVGRPDERAVEPDVVRGDAVRCQVVDQQQRVMVAFDCERRCAVAEDLDLARRARLDPESRALAARVAQHRPEDELGRPLLQARDHR